MSIQKIFLGSKGNLSIGCICSRDGESKTAVKYQAEYNSNQVGLCGVRENALYNVIQIMKKYKKADLAKLDRPIEFYVIESLASRIEKETYKFWLMTGKKTQGGEVDKNELALWDEFNKLMSKNGLYFVFRNIATANFKGVPKFNIAETKYNKFYHDWVWSEIHKLKPQNPELPQEPEEPAV